MQEMWDRRWLSLVAMTSGWGAPGGTGVASAIVAPPDRLVSLGVNGLPPAIAPQPERLAPEGERAFWCEHSERAALYHALANGAGVRGATIYSSMFPCADCMRGIILSGLARVVVPASAQPSAAYRVSVGLARQMLDEAGIALSLVTD
ncbi:hypothetical protein [Gemmobacter sp.]|uniref:hypothetical protein n=1 Tax=Gemmobacter sp. TaxID=1898957 RepID=UPI002AFF4DAE|nr:hypothetical protein [Gemmobacter sp.]